MNDIEVDFTYNNDSINVDPITTDDYDFEIFAVKGDKGDAGQNGIDGQDGKGITSVSKTSTSGLVDTYTITYTDNTTSTFEVTNGANGQDGTNGLDGADGRDGAIQYTAGDNITIENNVISAIGGGSSMYLGKFSDFASTGSYLDLTALEVGSYRIMEDDTTNYLYFGSKSSNKIYNPTKQGNGSYSHVIGDMYLMVTKKVSEVTGSSYEEVASFYVFQYTTQLNQSYDNTLKLYKYRILYSTTSGYYLDQYTYGYRCMGLDDDQTVTGLKTFNTLPESSVVPTTNNQLVNKKYVDDAIATAIANL